MFGYSFYKAVKKNTFITNGETRQKRCNCFSAVRLKKKTKKKHDTLKEASKGSLMTEVLKTAEPDEESTGAAGD